MIARVTLAEVDTLRIPLEAAIERYRTSVIPALEAEEGYAGCYVLATAEGKALVLTFWHDEAAAEAGLASGFYGAQVGKFVTSFRAPPGRETYDVVVAAPPLPAVTGGAP